MTIRYDGDELRLILAEERAIHDIERATGDCQRVEPITSSLDQGP